MGLKKQSSVHTLMYAIVKMIQITIGVGLSILQLLYLDVVANQATDFIIDEIIEEAVANHMKPPAIDRWKLLDQVTSEYQRMAAYSIFFWIIIGGYSLYIIVSLSKWLQQGVFPGRPQLVVRLPAHAVELTHLEAGERIQYATPFLQGQASVIPVELR